MNRKTGLIDNVRSSVSSLRHSHCPFTAESCWNASRTRCIRFRYIQTINNSNVHCRSEPCKDRLVFKSSVPDKMLPRPCNLTSLTFYQLISCCIDIIVTLTWCRSIVIETVIPLIRDLKIKTLFSDTFYEAFHRNLFRFVSVSLIPQSQLTKLFILQSASALWVSVWHVHETTWSTS